MIDYIWTLIYMLYEYQYAGSHHNTMAMAIIEFNLKFIDTVRLLVLVRFLDWRLWYVYNAAELVQGLRKFFAAVLQILAL